ncbi:MAG: TerB N-terminal domain-containing protein [Clostridia bacterium]|nr:TerB N-terminal domain-containing protein [Clostridia bacterium]
MPDNTPKSSPPRTAEELKQMAEEIRNRVRDTIQNAQLKPNAVSALQEKLQQTAQEIRDSAQNADCAISLEVDTLTPVERSVPAKEAPPLTGGDDFWDLGKPKPRVYQQPKFSEASLGVTEISGTDTAAEISVSVPGSSADHTSRTAQSEKILPREAYTFRNQPREVRSADRTAPVGSSSGHVVQTPDGPRSITTSSYKSHAHRHRPSAAPAVKSAKKASEVVCTYAPGGMLLRQIIVRTWESETEFYGRFAADAHRSHAAAPKLPADCEAEAVPYFSYVPQYAHMNLAQVEYYRWVRENIRMGRYPVCDLPYIQLYIFEIINLPDVIPPEEGVRLLCAVWLHYRKLYPRLDGYLCEWFADYCMIGGQPIPDALLPILPEIVPKAQFKEFWLNSLSAQGSDALGRTVLEVSSDYDYRGSRYYKDNAEAYETHIPAAVTLVLTRQLGENRGIFAMDRIYRMTRDSYCGAIVSSGIKRRLDIEFLSFTRRADTRQQVTALAKYAENRLRVMLGIKAKLGVDHTAPEDSAVIDAYFEPMMPAKVRKSKEDRYMPDDYLKNYESEDSGFDFSAAQAIEAQSWVNTSRLTGDDSLTEEHRIPADEPDDAPAVEGEISSADFPDRTETILPAPHGFDDAPEKTEDSDEIEAFDAVPGFAPQNTPITVPQKNAAVSAADTDSAADSLLRQALEAALHGEYRSFCRKNSLYEGEVADRINSIFLEELGDVVLENSGAGFTLIEDYREDVEHWLS